VALSLLLPLITDAAVVKHRSTTAAHPRRRQEFPVGNEPWFQPCGGDSGLPVNRVRRAVRSTRTAGYWQRRFQKLICLVLKKRNTSKVHILRFGGFCLLCNVYYNTNQILFYILIVIFEF